MSHKRQPRLEAPSVNPYAGLKEGDTALVGWPGGSPFEWSPTQVLWHDGCQVLVRMYGIAGNNPHNTLIDIDHIRAFGTPKFCSDQKRIAEQAAVGAVRQLRELEDMVRDVRLAVDRLIAALNEAAVKASNDPAVHVSIETTSGAAA